MTALTSISEILGILRSIVVHHKPANLCGRLNTFAVLDRMTQLNASNAEMTYQHYLEELFWERDWANDGADPNKMEKRYDALIVRAGSIEPFKSDKEAKTWVLPLMLNIVGEIKCEYCPEGCTDTKEGRRMQIIQTMQQVIDELMTYQKYEIEPATGTPFTAWSNEAQAAALITAGTWTDAVPTSIRLDASIMQDGFDIFVPDWNSLGRVSQRLVGHDTLVDNVVAVAARIDIEICDPTPEFSFFYETEAVQEVGIVKCNC